MGLLMDCNKDGFIAAIRAAGRMLEGMSIEATVQCLNDARSILHDHSPFRNHPVDCVRWVQVGSVHANDYNPNHVATPELRLLELSIREDGYTMPIVASARPDGSLEVVDGFHRRKVGAEKMQTEMHGYVPVSILNRPYESRMGSTIRHNRARGVHGVDPMSSIVAHLAGSGWNDEKIGKELGMDADEVLRLKQCAGLPSLFSDREFNEGWE